MKFKKNISQKFGRNPVVSLILTVLMMVGLGMVIYLGLSGRNVAKAQTYAKIDFDTGVGTGTGQIHPNWVDNNLTTSSGMRCWSTYTGGFDEPKTIGKLRVYLRGTLYESTFKDLIIYYKDAAGNYGHATLFHIDLKDNLYWEEITGLNLQNVVALSYTMIPNPFPEFPATCVFSKGVFEIEVYAVSPSPSPPSSPSPSPPSSPSPSPTVSPPSDQRKIRVEITWEEFGQTKTVELKAILKDIGL